MGFPMTLQRVLSRNAINPESTLADDIRRAVEDAVTLAAPPEPPRPDLTDYQRGYNDGYSHAAPPEPPRPAHGERAHGITAGCPDCRAQIDAMPEPPRPDRLRIAFESRFDDQWPEWMDRAWYEAIAEVGADASALPLDVERLAAAMEAEFAGDIDPGPGFGSRWWPDRARSIVARLSPSSGESEPCHCHCHQSGTVCRHCVPDLFSGESGSPSIEQDAHDGVWAPRGDEQ